MKKPLNKIWQSLHLSLRVLIGFFVLYLLILTVNTFMGVGPNLLMRWLNVTPNVRAFIGSTLTYGIRIAALVLLPALALRIVLQVDPWPRLFPRPVGWWKDLLFGAALVGVVLGAFFLIAVWTGGLVVETWRWLALTREEWLRVFWVGLLVNVGVAIGEETVFRGYLLTGLNAAWGRARALIGMMVVFGLFHLPAYSEGGMDGGVLALAIGLASLFGLLFGLIYLKTGSLWLPISLHFSWNFLENDLFNITAVNSSPNLAGAVTRLQSPLTMSELVPGNIMVLEIMAFGLIVLGCWLWLRDRPDAGPALEETGTPENPSALV